MKTTTLAAIQGTLAGSVGHKKQSPPVRTEIRTAGRSGSLPNDHTPAGAAGWKPRDREREERDEALSWEAERARQLAALSS